MACPRGYYLHMMATLPNKLKIYIENIPKAELHIHIEGTLEPELMFSLAKRNGIQLKGTVESNRDKRKNFKVRNHSNGNIASIFVFLSIQNLQDFLDIYYEACSVLLKEEDFYDLMYAYLHRAAEDNVFIAEVFFDPQTHTERGVSIDIVINGLHRAIIDGYRDFGIKGSLILCFLRHLPLEKHLETLAAAKPHLDKILGVGLDSGEVGNQPHKFTEVFVEASKLGLKIVAHAGEEGGPEYIYEALDLLHAQRIDHGVQCLHDDKLVERLVRDGIPLTVCPCSNDKLQVFSRYFSGQNITKVLLDKGLKVTINSDDPAYFGGYITDNFIKAAVETNMTEKDIYQICLNAFNATFLSLVDKDYCIRKLQQFNINSGFAAPRKSVTIFGSRSTQHGTALYDTIFKVAARFASNGYRIISGGYNGTMAAATMGATNAGGEALGVVCPRIFLENDRRGNEWLTHVNVARDLYDRISRMIEASEYIIVFPGTIGTLTELLVSWNVSSFRPISENPVKHIYLYRDPFEKVTSDINATLRIVPQEHALLSFFDDPEKLFELIHEDWKRRQSVATL